MAKQRRSGHFSNELFKFLRQLERNNNREWFEKNKERYVEHVRDPMLAFIADFAPLLRRTTPYLVADPRPHGGSMFRIYRDTRFSKDKRPYKTWIAARFGHVRGKDVHSPCFYLSIGLTGVYAGSGIWHPDGDSLARIRGAIVDQPAKWKRSMSGKEFRETLELGGDSLKRPPRAFDPDHPLVEDLKRKDFVALAKLDRKAVCAPDFVDRYTTTCRAAVPFLKFLAEALDIEW